MKLLIGLVALSVYSVSTTPTPQLFGPLSSVGNFFQNTIQGFPRPPFFQNGFAFGPFRPQTQQVLNPPQQMAAQQIIPAQENAQSFNVPIRQISNNGWYWQNWIPMPVIPQYPADQSPTIIIISHPSKPQTAENPNPNPTDTASSIQSTNNSAVVPTTNESTNSTTLSTPTPVSNSSESSTTAPLPAVAQSSGEYPIKLF